MKIKLCFLDEFKSNFKEKEYTISSFIDPKSLVVISGSNLKHEKPFIKGELYECEISLKANKLKVVKIFE